MKSSILRNSKGISLVEVMITVGVIAISVIATMTLQKTNLDVQRQNRLIQTLQENKARIRTLISSDDAWNKTMAQNDSLACLRNLTACPAGTFEFNLWDGSPVTYPMFFSLNNANIGTNGFSEMGSVCNTHDAGGSSSCPIAYKLQWTPICSAAPPAPCINPAINIDVTAFYRPDPPDSGPSIKMETYGFTNFVRTLTGITKSFQAVSFTTAGAGGGPCAGTVQRVYTETDPINSTSMDPFNMITIAAGSPNIQLLDRGSYRCSGSAVGFGIGSFQVLFKVDGVTKGIGNGFGPDGIQVTAAFNTTFVTTGPANLTVEQVCSKQPPPPLTNFALGTPAESSPGVYIPVNIYSTVSCTKLTENL